MFESKILVNSSRKSGEFQLLVQVLQEPDLLGPFLAFILTYGGFRSLSTSFDCFFEFVDNFGCFQTLSDTFRHIYCFLSFLRQFLHFLLLVVFV